MSAAHILFTVRPEFATRLPGAYDGHTRRMRRHNFIITHGITHKFYGCVVTASNLAQISAKQNEFCVRFETLKLYTAVTV